MDSKEPTTITINLLDDLEKTSGVVDIHTQNDFLNVLKLDKAIIYLLVNWSGPERISRYYVYKAFNDLDKTGVFIFKIDCSDEEKKYIEDWLIGQREKQDFYFGGWGETLLIEKGEIADFIRNPGQKKKKKTKKKIKEWSTCSAATN